MQEKELAPSAGPHVVSRTNRVDPPAPDVAVASGPAPFTAATTSTQLTLLMVGSLGPMVGAAIAPALPFIHAHFATEPGADFLVRLMLTIPALAIAIVAPFAGYIVDRHSKQRVLLVAVTVYIAFGSGGLFLNDMNGLLISRAGLGVATAFIMCCVTALAGDLFEPMARAGFLGKINSTNSITGMIFVLCGGMLADLNWRAAFLIYVSMLPVLILLWRFIPNQPPASAANERVVVAGERSMHWGQVGVLYALAIVSSIFFYLVLTQSPFLITHEFNGSGGLSGLAIGVFTIAGFPFSFSYGRIRRSLSSWAVFAIGFAATGSGFVLQSFADSITELIVGMAVTGTGFGLIVPNVSATLLASVPQHLRGRAAGIVVSCFFLGQFLSPLFSQPIVNRHGLSACFLLAGATLLAVAALMMLMHYGLRSAADRAESATL